MQVKPSIVRGYNKLRGNGWTAAAALRHVKIDYKFRALEAGDLVRLRIEPDDCVSMDDLKGDTYNRKANPDIPEARMAREEKEFEERIERDGVWGIVTEYWNEAKQKWEFADSCYGFVGNDWEGSGYDSDLKQSAILQYEAQQMQALAM